LILHFSLASLMLERHDLLYEPKSAACQRKTSVSYLNFSVPGGAGHYAVGDDSL
jgi:hypothetical protein